MLKSRDTIGEKIKAIKAKQQEEIESGQFHVHDPKNFTITKQSSISKDIHGGVYFYNKSCDLKQNGLIYLTNRNVYAHAENVDTFISGVAVYTSYKAIKNLYAAAMGQPWYPFYTAVYTALSYI